MQTLAPDSFCPLTDPQPYQREQDQPPLVEPSMAWNESALVIESEAVRRPAVGCIVLLDGRRESWNRHEATARIVHDLRIEVDQRLIGMKRVVQVLNSIAASRMKIGWCLAANPYLQKSSAVFRGDKMKAAPRICDCGRNGARLWRAEN